MDKQDESEKWPATIRKIVSLWNKYFEFLGWLVGVLSPFFFVLNVWQTPDGAPYNFLGWSMLAAILGFSVANVIFKKGESHPFLLAIIPVIGFIACICLYTKYQDMLLSITGLPTPEQYKTEFFIFCLMHALVYIIIAYIYRFGGRFVIGKIGI